LTIAKLLFRGAHPLKELGGRAEVVTVGDMAIDARTSALIAVSSAKMLRRASTPPRPGSAARVSRVLRAVSQWAGGMMNGGEDPIGKVDGEEKSATRSYAMKLL